jgi:hypothetical protein
MKKTLATLRVLLPLLILTASVPAEAKLFEVWGSGLVGYGYGTGDGDNDFYRWVRGGAGGVEVGIKILFIGVFVDYLRFFGGSAGANLITINLGGDWAIGLTKRLSLVLRGAGGYYHATLPDDVKMVVDNVEVPIDDNVNTRGVGVRGGVGLRYSFAKVLSIGVTPEFGWHYFFGGAEEPITQTDNNSSGFDLTALAYFRVGIGF